MNTGIRRKVDDLGRVVIPAGIRRSLSIREGDAVEVHVEGDQVILSKPADHCVFCRDDEGLQTFREKAVCRRCVAAVGVLDEDMRSTRAPEPAAAEAPAREPSNLPPWPVGRERDNGGAWRTGPEPASTDQPPRRPDREDREDPESRPDHRRRDERPDRAAAPGRNGPGQEPPASTTAW